MMKIQLTQGYETEIDDEDWDKVKDYKWQAQIRCKQQKLYLGLFKDPVEAAKVYDEKAKELFGEFANINFDGGR